MREYKTFKDANGETVKIGNVVSVTKEVLEKNKGFEGTFIVKEITRSRRDMEIKLYSNLHQRYCYASGKHLVNEEF
jgi:hypothetical protein